MKNPASASSGTPAAAFTLLELLVVLAILGMLIATQLPALTRAKSPVKHAQCLSNLRQLGTATSLYRADSDDEFPYGNRVRASGTGISSVVDPRTWPMQLLPYVSGTTNIPTNQPPAYVCPSERNVATNWVYQLHYLANRHVISDIDDVYMAMRGHQIGKPSIFMLFMEKSPAEFGSTRPGTLNIVAALWNTVPGSPQYRRHEGRCAATAVDGHVEMLLLSPYFGDGTPAGDAAPNRVSPSGYFIDLGDTSDAPPPPSTWPGSGREKLFFRRIQGSGAGAF